MRGGRNASIVRTDRAARLPRSLRRMFVSRGLRQRQVFAMRKGRTYSGQAAGKSLCSERQGLIAPVTFTGAVGGGRKLS